MLIVFFIWGADIVYLFKFWLEKLFTSISFRKLLLSSRLPTDQFSRSFVYGPEYTLVMINIVRLRSVKSTNVKKKIQNTTKLIIDYQFPLLIKTSNWPFAPQTELNLFDNKLQQTVNYHFNRLISSNQLSSWMA